MARGNFCSSFIDSKQTECLVIIAASGKGLIFPVSSLHSMIDACSIFRRDLKTSSICRPEHDQTPTSNKYLQRNCQCLQSRQLAFATRNELGYFECLQKTSYANTSFFKHLPKIEISSFDPINGSSFGLDDILADITANGCIEIFISNAFCKRLLEYLQQVWTANWTPLFLH